MPYNDSIKRNDPVPASGITLIAPYFFLLAGEKNRYDEFLNVQCEEFLLRIFKLDR